MQITDHIQQLLWVEVYADSDKYRNPADARGPENVETVEILLAGEVLYPAQDGTLQRFGRGTIFISVCQRTFRIRKHISKFLADLE